MSIGGFFEMEWSLPDLTFHPRAIALTSGRACLTAILSKIQAKKIYLPYYCCDSVLVPLQKLGIAFEFYALDENLNPTTPVTLANNEFILYINYFGMKMSMVDELYQHYGNRLIIDNSQAFFEKRYQDCWSFNSARKFFGVADGGYLYAQEGFDAPLSRNQHISYAHLIERLIGNASAHSLFVESEATISAEILRISLFSEKLLSGVDYAQVMKKRLQNFHIYQEAFADLNRFVIPDTTAIPFCYPLWLPEKIERHNLYAQGIFFPTLWHDVVARNEEGYEFEKIFSQQLLPLPIDHRYSTTDCQAVVESILNYVRENHASCC